MSIDAGEELQELSRHSREVARSFKIETNEEYLVASENLRKVRGLAKRIEDIFGASVKAAKAAHYEALSLRDKALRPVKEADEIYRKGIDAYLTEINKRRDDQEAALKAKAGEIAQEERDHAVAKLVEVGRVDEAQALEAKPVEAIPVALGNTVPKAEGISTRTTWKHRVVDETKVPRRFLMIDEKKLAAFARAMKDSEPVEGVEFYAEQGIAVRS